MPKLPSITEMALELAMKSKPKKVIQGTERQANLNKFLESSKLKEPVYHSTFNDFSIPKVNFGHEEHEKFGFHVGTPEQANTRMKHLMSSTRPNDTSNVMPLYAQVKNPLVLNENRHGRWGVDDIMSTIMEKADKGELPHVNPEHVNDFYEDAFNIDTALGKKDKGRVWQDHDKFAEGERSKLLTDYLKNLGHDSIAYENNYEGSGTSHILLDPSQIKSAIGNEGTFNPNEPDITKADGGRVHLSIAGDVAKQALKQGVKVINKAPMIMKKVSKSTPELQEAIREMKKKGEIVESSKPLKPEFIQPNPKLSQNPAGYSRSQWEKNQQYQHNIVPTHEFSEPEMINAESIEGHPLILVSGDRTIGGAQIVDVNGNPLTSPSQMYAGASYGHEMADKGIDEFWASQLAAASGVQNKAIKAYLETGKLPLGIYTSMGPETGNYSLHNLDVALKSLYNKNPSNTQMQAFNSIMKQGFKKGKDKKTGEDVYVRFPDFVGIENPEELRAQLESNPEMRKFFINRLETEKSVSTPLDLPEGMAIRHAITEPALRDVPTGTTGYSIGALHPESSVHPNIFHPTYDTSIPGNYLGRMELQLPWKEYFPTNYEKIMSNPAQATSSFGTMQGLNTYEMVTPEMVDRLMKMNELIKTGKFKDGGQVQNFDEGGKATVSIEGVKYEPQTTYTDPMGASVPSLDDMRYQLSKQNMSPIQQSEPYRDPITGAIVEKSLEALPPGSNIPKSGGMTPIDWNNLPQEQKKASIGDKIAGILEAGTTLGTGMGAFMAGFPYSIGKGLITGANPEATLGDIMQNYTYIPRSQSGVENLESIGKVLDASKLPPIMPELHGLESAISAGSKALLKKGINAPVGASIKDVSGFSPKDEFGFYSKLEKESKNLQRKQGNGQAFMNDLMKLGVKPHELEATGMGEFLKNNNKLTKEDVQGYAERNRPVMNEVYLGKELPPLKLKEVSDKNSQARELFDIPDFNPQRYNYGTYDIKANNQSVGKIFETEDNNYYVYLPDIAGDGPFINKQEALDFVKQRLENYEIGTAKHEHHFRTPGGENYRELLIQAPNQKELRGTKSYDDIAKRMYGKDFVSLPMEERHNVANIANSKQYTEGHYEDYPNTMINMRMDDRIDVEGKKGTLLDELQSDWHQEGKEKGYASDNPFLKMPQMSADEMLLKHGDQMNPEQKRYLENFIKNWERVENNNQSDEIKQKRLDERTEDFQRWVEKQKIANAIPDAPYKNNWHELGLKKAIQHAVERGDDRLYLPTGNTLADRYDLSKQINELSYKPLNDKFYTDNLSEKYYLISAIDKNGKPALHQQVTESELSNTVGKELAKKIIDGEGEADNFGNKTFTGLDLKVGGEGMRKYYDEIYPSYLKKFAKKYGGHVGETEIMISEPSYRIVDNEGKLVYSQDLPSKAHAEAIIKDLYPNDNDIVIQPIHAKFQKVYYYEPSEESVAKIRGGLPYKKGGIVKKTNGGSVMETEIAKMKEFIAKKKIEDELSGMAKRSEELRAFRPYENLTEVKPVTPEQVNAEYQARQAKPTVGLRPTDVGGSRIPSTQLELFKKRGGVIKMDEGGIVERANRQLNQEQQYDEPSTALFNLVGGTEMPQNPNIPQGSVQMPPSMAMAHLGHNIHSHHGNINLGATGVSVDTPQGRLNKLAGIDATYEHPSGFFARINKPTGGMTPPRFDIGYRKTFADGGLADGGIFDIMGNFAGYDSTIPVANKQQYPVIDPFQEAMKFTLAHEGGFNALKHDKPTNYGITQDVYSKYIGRPASIDDMKNMPIEHAHDIYKTQYWNPIQKHNLDVKPAVVAFDTAVNQGPTFANNMIKETQGDVEAMIQAREKRYADVIKNNPKKAKFKEGWNNRISDLKNYALEDLYAKGGKVSLDEMKLALTRKR